jgi:hypothetical protein
LALARKGECVEAMPLLESAEGANHRPETAVALADCYVQLGALLNAKVLYDVVALETPERSHTRADRNAIASVRKKLKDVETRIPTLAFTIPAELIPPSPIRSIRTMISSSRSPLLVAKLAKKQSLSKSESIESSTSSSTRLRLLFLPSRTNLGIIWA